MSQVAILSVASSPLPPDVATSYVTNSGTATPSANVLRVFGGTQLAASSPVSTSASGIPQNIVNVLVQFASDQGTSSALNAGLASFDSSQFIVDANGFVQLTTPGEPAIIGINVDESSGGGSDPIFSDGSGILTITGDQVNSGTHLKAISTNSTLANEFSIDVQRSNVSNGSNVALNGLSHFDSSSFNIDSNGYVTLLSTGAAKTLTGDSGGALSPTANNWNILGLSGSKTSGSGSTLTIKSPPFSQIGSTATSSLNTGEFVTAAVTRTLPASAGLIDGDLFIFVCTTANALVVQSVTAQKIRIGNVITSAAGTATSTAIGDSLTLRFNATDGFFYAVSVIGNWTLSP